MKNILRISVLSIILMTVIASCKKDDDSSTNSSPSSSTALNNGIKQGTWRISYFNDSGNDETSHYTDYMFQFNSNGTVTANKSGNSVSGNWSTGNDDSTAKLLLNFNVIPFTELNEDWHLIEQSSNLIKLEHVSGGNGGTEYLTFEKI